MIMCGMLRSMRCPMMSFFFRYLSTSTTTGSERSSVTMLPHASFLSILRLALMSSSSFDHTRKRAMSSGLSARAAKSPAHVEHLHARHLDRSAHAAVHFLLAA